MAFDSNEIASVIIHSRHTYERDRKLSSHAQMTFIRFGFNLFSRNVIVGSSALHQRLWFADSDNVRHKRVKFQRTNDVDHPSHPLKIELRARSWFAHVFWMHFWPMIKIIIYIFFWHFEHAREVVNILYLILDYSDLNRRYFSMRFRRMLCFTRCIARRLQMDKLI